MLCHTFIFLSIFFRAVISISGLKILGVFPQAHKSHINFNNAIMSTLAAAGHDVTMISPFQECAKENYTFIDTSKQISLSLNSFLVTDSLPPGPSVLVHYLLHDESHWCRTVMELKEIQDALNSTEKPYDLIFAEIQTVYPCYIILARKWKIPVIGTISLFQWNYADYAISNTRNPAIIPDENISSYFYESFISRLINTINYLRRVYLWYNDVKPATTKLFEDYSKQLAPHLKYEEVEPSLIFYNGHFSIFSRSMNPNAINIGGIHIKKAEPLPEILQKFIEESKHGVILFTLGSMVKSSSFDEKSKQALLQAFSAIPQRVIWKFEEQMEQVPENVLLVKWLPQRDILAHKKVIAFISHCGISGIYEAIHEEVPVIAIAVYVDQHPNAEFIARNGAGLILDKDSLTRDTILNALNTVINDTSYAENMKKLSQKFKDRPSSPQETVVYWTEYVHRHNGAPHLKTAASELYWFQYLLLDVIFFIVFIIVLVIFVLKLLIKSVLYYVICKSNKSENVNMNKYDKKK